MPKPFEPDYHYALTRRRIIGLEERRVRKNYYPQLQQRLEELKRSELRYRALFENSPISLWEEDFSRLKSHFDQLKEDGVDDFSVKLTGAESALLACLMQRPGVAVPCQQLAWEALGYRVDDEEASSIVRPHISRLRRKIESDSSQPRLIRTVPGKRYLFDPHSLSSET